MYINFASLKFFSLIILLTGLITNTLTAEQFRYVFPANISLAFGEDCEEANDKIKLTATIESKLGNLSNLEVSFASSQDLKVISNTRTLKSLKAGDIRKVKILAVKTDKKPDEMGTWVKMGVRYLPDYQAIIATANDTTKFPDQFERQRLLDIASKNQKSASIYSESTRHFLKSEGK